jgi:hypothetical protein
MKKKSVTKMPFEQAKGVIYARGYYAGKKAASGTPLTEAKLKAIIKPTMTLLDIARAVEKAHNIKDKAE